MLRLSPVFACVLALAAFATGCASAPPPAPVVVPFESKMSWIVRLEDQRTLRDPAPPVVPAPVTGRRTVLPPPPPPPDLIRLLSDEEARIRRRAAAAVGRVGLVEGVAPLVKLMQADSDAEVRQMAAFALGLIGDASAVEPLRTALGDASPLVSGRAAEALGLVGDVASAPAIGKLVAAHVADAAALPTDQMRPPAGTPADAFRLGVFALARLKAYEPLAVAVLTPDGQPRVSWWPVAYALQRIEDKRALPALLALAANGNQETQAFAIKGLGAIGDDSAVPALIPLIDPVRAITPPGIEAIRALARLRDGRAEPALTKLLYTRGLNPMVRAETLLALGESEASVSVDAFVDFLGDPLPVVRVAALRGFSKREDDSFLTVLSGLDPDPHWSVRAALAGILAEKDAERALPRLEPMLADQDARVLPAVLNALTKLKAPGIEKILLDRLGSEDVMVRATSAAGVGELKPDGGVEALAAAYKRGEVDLVFDTRTAAIEALAKYGSAAAMPTLKTALNDKDWVVRARAASLIKTLDPTVDVDGRHPTGASRTDDELREPRACHPDRLAPRVHRYRKRLDRDRARRPRRAAYR